MKKIIVGVLLLITLVVGHTVETQGTNTRHRILVSDNWVKVASVGETINISNEANSEAKILPSDVKPDDAVKWGKTLHIDEHIPYVCVHDVYVRATRATVIVVITKD